MPVPLSVATCGEPAALSVMLMEPVLPPVAVGVKVMLMEQVAKDAIEPPQIPPDGTVDATAKSPEGVMEEIVKVPEPVLVRMMLLAAEVVESVCCPKSKDVGFKLTPGVAATPVPFKVTECGEPVALSTKVSNAVLAPAAVGVNVGKAPQVEPEASDAGQLLVCPKSPALVPVMEMLVIATLMPAPEVFVNVAVCDGLVVPTVREA